MIYFVEDDASIRELVLYTLNNAGFQAEGFERPSAFWKAVGQMRPTLILLDIMLPDIDGFEVCRSIRATNKAIGIIMLTARTQEMDKVTGLMTGADDYVTKPFSVVELVARVDALYRRVGGTASNTDLLISGPFELNLRSREFKKNGARIEITQVEYMLIKTFMENPDRAMSREELLSIVWGRDYIGDLKIVDVNIRRLRLKIEEDAAAPKYITTLWGFGYKWGGGNA